MNNYNVMIAHQQYIAKYIYFTCILSFWQCFRDDMGPEISFPEPVFNP